MIVLGAVAFILSLSSAVQFSPAVEAFKPSQRQGVPRLYCEAQGKNLCTILFQIGALRWMRKPLRLYCGTIQTVYTQRGSFVPGTHSYIHFIGKDLKFQVSRYSKQAGSYRVMAHTVVTVTMMSQRSLTLNTEELQPSRVGDTYTSSVREQFCVGCVVPGAHHTLLCL